MDLPGLKDLGNNKPANLYIRGKWPAVDRSRVACVVGSRRMSAYGDQAVRRLVIELVERKMVILSGLMYGIDKTAHKTCLEFGGVTVAVLGWGIDEPVGYDDERLIKAIVDSGGAVLSEWQTQPASRWTFPRRDRIMAALSSEIYVVEAAEKSGSLITASWGERLGRKLWAMPGPITSRVSSGTNRLIAEGRASIWLPENNLIINGQCTTKRTDIYSILQKDTLTIDEISRALNKPVEKVIGDITLMMLKGEVEEKEGKYGLLKL